MGFIKRIFCSHEWALYSVTPQAREGTMIVTLVCPKCEEAQETFHDLTEEDEEFMPLYRNPAIEQLLIEEGLVVKKKGKLVLQLPE